MGVTLDLMRGIRTHHEPLLNDWLSLKPINKKMLTHENLSLRELNL